MGSYGEKIKKEKEEAYKELGTVIEAYRQRLEPFIERYKNAKNKVEFDNVQEEEFQLRDKLDGEQLSRSDIERIWCFVGITTELRGANMDAYERITGKKHDVRSWSELVWDPHSEENIEWFRRHTARLKKEEDEAFKELGPIIMEYDAKFKALADRYRNAKTYEQYEQIGDEKMALIDQIVEKYREKEKKFGPDKASKIFRYADQKRECRRVSEEAYERITGKPYPIEHHGCVFRIRR